MTIRFDRFSIDTETFELSADGIPLHVEPLVLDLIIEMSRSPGALHTRDDLIETVWNGRIVSDTTISTAVKSARKVLGDTGSEQRFIRTVRGRGFQFLGDVASEAPPHTNAPASDAGFPILSVRFAALDDTIPAAATRALEVRLRSVLGRMPFLNITASSNEGASEGMRPTHLLEVALSSLDGTTYADANLSNTATGFQIWARHFSAPTSQGVSNLVMDVGAKAEPQILKAISRHLAQQNADDPKALTIEAMQVIAERGMNPKSMTLAIALLEKAVSNDPNLPIAYALLALMNAVGHRVGILRRDDSVVARALEAAEKALALEGQSSAVLSLTGCALCDVGQLSRGEPIIDRALDLDPMNGHAHAAKGAAKMMHGDFTAALAPLRKSIQISPADSRLAVWGAILAMAELHCGEPENARLSAEQAMSRDDCNYLPRLAAVAVHMSTGNTNLFEASLLELLRVHPEITSNEVLFFIGPQAKEALWPTIEAHRKGP